MKSYICSKLVIALASEYVEVRLNALQTMITVQAVRKSRLDHGTHLIIPSVRKIACNNSVVEGNDGPTDYHATDVRCAAYVGC
jgi:hypothetical protein